MVGHDRCYREEDNNAKSNIAYMALDCADPLVLFNCERMQVRDGLARYTYVSMGLVIHSAAHLLLRGIWARTPHAPDVVADS